MPSPSKHSAVVGGSTAQRLVNCPASVAILEKLPKQINVTTEWAEEGSDLHGLIAKIIDSEGTFWPVAGETKAGATLITQELMHDCIEPVWQYWLEVQAHLDEFAVEVEAAFPGIAGAFGTCDLAGRSKKLNTTWITDWKFGAGHGVTVTYQDPSDSNYEIVNEQPLFYACCLRHEFPDWFPKGVRIVLTIAQPRHQDPTLRKTTTDVSTTDLDDFERELVAAIKASRKPDATMLIGPWCTFAACKPVCPLHNAPLLDLAAIEKAALAPAKDYDHAAVIAFILDKAPIAEAIIAEARKQAYEMMEAGHDIPGWKLVAKQGRRRWNQDDVQTIRLLRRLFRLKKAEVTDLVLKSPHQVEKLRPNIVIGAELAALHSSGSTLAPVNAKRPAVLPQHENLKDLLKLSLEHATKEG